jgi:hypothetical protein
MPGFKSHSIFAKIILKGMPKSTLKDKIMLHETCFQMGNQGPDFLFYYLPAHIIGRNNPGDILHTTKVSEMFETMLKYRTLYRNDDLNIIDSYIAGFFGHYILDSKMHPYIYYRTNHLQHIGEITYDFGIHSFLETDIDQTLISHFLHISPLEYKPWKKIVMTLHERHIISSLMYHSIKTLYPKLYINKHSISRAMFMMALEQRLMYDRNARKKAFLRRIDQLSVHHAFISPLVPFIGKNYYRDPLNLEKKTWSNPWLNSKKSNKSVLEIIEDSAAKYNTILEAYNSLIIENYDSYGKLLGELENKSYLTGLEL